MEESLVKNPEGTVNVNMYSPLALAYIGDSIFDLTVKEYFVKRVNMQPAKYHHRVSQIVSARSQAGYIDARLDTFTEKEQEIYRRGKNSSPHHTAKNASILEYTKATGFEAVIGYLYLSGNTDRVRSISEDVIAYNGLDI